MSCRRRASVRDRSKDIWEFGESGSQVTCSVRRFRGQLRSLSQVIQSPGSGQSKKSDNARIAAGAYSAYLTSSACEMRSARPELSTPVPWLLFQ